MAGTGPRTGYVLVLRLELSDVPGTLGRLGRLSETGSKFPGGAANAAKEKIASARSGIRDIWAFITEWQRGAGRGE